MSWMTIIMQSCESSDLSRAVYCSTFFKGKKSREGKKEKKGNRKREKGKEKEKKRKEKDKKGMKKRENQWFEEGVKGEENQRIGGNKSKSVELSTPLDLSLHTDGLLYSQHYHTYW